MRATPGPATAPLAPHTPPPLARAAACSGAPSGLRAPGSAATSPAPTAAASMPRAGRHAPRSSAPLPHAHFESEPASPPPLALQAPLPEGRHPGSLPGPPAGPPAPQQHPASRPPAAPCSTAVPATSSDPSQPAKAPPASPPAQPQQCNAAAPYPPVELDPFSLWEAHEQPGPQPIAPHIAALTPFKPTHADWERMGVPARPRPAPDECFWAQRLHRVVELMRGPVQRTPDTAAAFELFVRGHGRAEGSLSGGQLSGYAQVWQALANLLPRELHAQQVVDWVRNGVQLQFCHPHDPQKAGEPRHQAKRAAVERSLRNAGYADPGGMLDSARPPPCALGNRLADPEDTKFAREQVAAAVSGGVVRRWPFPGTRPWVVVALAVARAAHRKPRLIWDGQYPNLFLQYIAFRYQTLMDFVSSADCPGFISTKDLKSGYHHVQMAADAWPYLGFALDGQLYVFTCLPFGLSQAPFVFTRVLEVAYALPRALSWRITAMVDDSAQPSSVHAVGRWQAACVVWLEAALGFLHSWEKCQLFPVRCTEFLGLLADTGQGRLFVPARKLERFATLASAAASGDAAAWRSALGLLASFSPALHLGRLLGGWLRERSEEQRPDQRSVQTFLAFWQPQLPRLNGRPWHLDLTPALQVVGDASESAHGGLVRGSNWRASIPFSQQELEDMAAQRLPSTVREVRCAYVILRELLRTHPQAVQGRCVQIWGDNQGAIYACERMRGCPAVFAEVRRLHELAWSAQITLTFVWHPRSQYDLRLADSLSKRADPADWRLSSTFAEQQIFRIMGRPDIDCFASKWAHQCRIYFSAVWDGECSGVDGLQQSWAEWPRGAPRAEPPLCFVFPPQALLARALAKVRSDRANAVVVCARELPAAAAAALARLPVSATVPLCGPHTRMMQPGPAVPRHMQEGGWKTPLQAIRVQWGGM